MIFNFFKEDSRYGDGVIFSLGLIIGCFIICLASDLIFKGFSEKLFAITLFSWASIRFISLTRLYLSKRINKIQSLSLPLAIFTYILLFLFLGFLRIDFPLSILQYLFLADLILYLYLNLRMVLSLKTNFIIGLFLGIAICIFCGRYSGQSIWFSYLSFSSHGYIDTFRDAAFLNSWAKYGAITNGTHGLLFTPYCTLYAQLLTPLYQFFNSNGLLLLQYYCFIVSPAILIYGLYELIKEHCHKLVIENKFFYLVIFVFTFSAMTYDIAQRSTMGAMYLAIVSLPLLICAWQNRKEPALPLFILALTVPLTVYARGFNGMVLIALVAPLIFDRKPFWKGAFPLVGCILGVLVLICYYGETKRNSGLHLKPLIQLWWPHSPTYGFQFLVGIFLIVLAIILIRLWMKIKSPLAKKFCQADSRLLFLGLYTMFGLTICCLKAASYSDVCYFTILSTWVLFFIFFSTPVFSHVEELIHPLIEVKIKRKGIKLLILIIIFVIYYHVNFDILGARLKGDLIFAKSLPKTNCLQGIQDPLCNLREKYFHLGNIVESSKNTYIAKMGETAQKKANQLSGNTAIYIPPKNKYWRIAADPRTASIYFMSVFSIPQIFGLNSTNFGFGFPVVAGHNGTVKSLKSIGGLKQLCYVAKSVHISNVIIFSRNSLAISKTIQCK